MASYQLLREAEQDIDDIWRWSYRRWSRDQADRYVRSLAVSMAELADDPDRGRSAAEIDSGLLRQRCESHVIFYRLADHGIDVVRVLHVKMNWASHLKDDE